MYPMMLAGEALAAAGIGKKRFKLTASVEINIFSIYFEANYVVASPVVVASNCFLFSRNL